MIAFSIPSWASDWEVFSFCWSSVLLSINCTISDFLTLEEIQIFLNDLLTSEKRNLFQSSAWTWNGLLELKHVLNFSEELVISWNICWFSLEFRFQISTLGEYLLWEVKDRISSRGLWSLSMIVFCEFVKTCFRSSSIFIDFTNWYIRSQTIKKSRTDFSS